MDDIEHRYRKMEPIWRRLEEEAKFILDAGLRSASVKVHSLVSRTKSLNSISEKALRRSYSSPLEQLEDLVGVRIVCLLRSDIVRIGRLLRDQFDVLSEDNKLDGANIEVFGYQSVHFIVRLKESCAGPRYQGLHDIRFEVQVRTLAMDAWAALSHYLDYKSEPDVPKDLRKDFFALSGLFYVADSHFELFYSERQKSMDAARQSAMGMPTAGQELNLDTLTAFLRARYPKRQHADSSGVSELLGELLDSGYATLDKVHAALDASAEAFKRYEKLHPPEAKKGRRFLDIGIVRISLGILDAEFAKKKYAIRHRVHDFRKYVQRKKVS